MRHFYHITLKRPDDSEAKLLPIFLHFNDLKWFTENSTAIFNEVRSIIVENIDLIEKKASGRSNINDLQPTRLHSMEGSIALAVCTSPRREFANYSILTKTNQTQTCNIYPFELVAWIFSIDPNNPYAPLPMECS
jgi:hypothetical protein